MYIHVLKDIKQSHVGLLSIDKRPFLSCEIGTSNLIQEMIALFGQQQKNDIGF